jgi:hypothetical protein
VIDGLPSLVLLVALCVESARWSAWSGGVVAGLAVVGSKVWFHINQGEFGDPLASPAQRFFMNHGPYMSFSSFWMQSLAVGVAGLIVYVISRRWPAANGQGGPPTGSITEPLPVVRQIRIEGTRLPIQREMSVASGRSAASLALVGVLAIQGLAALAGSHVL